MLAFYVLLGQEWHLAGCPKTKAILIQCFSCTLHWNVFPPFIRSSCKSLAVKWGFFSAALIKHDILLFNIAFSSMPLKVCCGMAHFKLKNDDVKELVFWKCSYRGSLSHELLLYIFCESSFDLWSFQRLWCLASPYRPLIKRRAAHKHIQYILLNK